MRSHLGRSSMDGIPFFLLVVNLGLVDIFRFTDVTAAVHTLNCSSGDDFKDKDLFGDAIAVNLAIMLVMTTIFTSKIEELPPTSDMKMIDIWLIFCLIVPFLEVILRTAIECLNCSCHICKQKDANKAKSEKEDKKKEGDAIQGVSYGEVTPVWVGIGAKVAPQQVTNYISE